MGIARDLDKDETAWLELVVELQLLIEEAAGRAGVARRRSAAGDVAAAGAGRAVEIEGCGLTYGCLSRSLGKPNDKKGHDHHDDRAQCAYPPHWCSPRRVVGVVRLGRGRARALRGREGSSLARPAVVSYGSATYRRRRA